MKKQSIVVLVISSLLLFSCSSLFESTETRLPDSISESDEYITFDEKLINVSEFELSYSSRNVYIPFGDGFYIHERVGDHARPKLPKYNLKEKTFTYDNGYYVNGSTDFDIWFDVKNGMLEIRHYYSDFSMRKEYIFDESENDSKIAIGNSSIYYDLSKILPEYVRIEDSEYGGTNYYLSVPINFVDDILDIASSNDAFFEFGQDRILIDRNVKYLIKRYSQLAENYETYYKNYVSNFRAKIENVIPDLTDYEFQMICEEKIYRGMRESVLYASWGYPRRTNSSSGIWGNSKQLVYGSSPYSSYVYVENGYVTSWQI